MILMLNNINNLNNAVKDAFHEYGISCEVVFLYSQYPELSDIQCNELLKHQKADFIDDLAKEIAIKLNNLEEVEKCEIREDLFINVSLSNKFLERQLTSNKNWAEAFDSSLKNKFSKKILIDYGGPNIGKALHVGHLRSLSIGRSLYRMNEVVGNHITSDIHLGDWGMPVAYMIALVEKEGIELESIDYEDLEKVYPRAVAYAEENEEFYELAKNISVQLNKGDSEYIKKWEKISTISTKYIEKNLSRLNHTFDLWRGESSVNSRIKPMITQLSEENMIVENQGAMIANIDLDPPILITKSDGSYLYITTDLATVIQREEEGFDEIIYIVDNRQKKHFEQLFNCVKYFNLSKASLKHVGFGTINGKDGKPLKTRDGDVYKLHQLHKDIEEKLVSYGTPTDSINKLVNDILTYSDLLTNRNTDYKFDIEKFTDVQGKTAIYVEYAYVRGDKVIKDSSSKGWEGTSTPSNFKISNTIERELVVELLKFKSYLDLSLVNNEPHHLADYVYTVAKKMNAFYENEKILNLEYKEASQKLFLLEYSLHILSKGMYCLGMDPVKKL